MNKYFLLLIRKGINDKHRKIVLKKEIETCIKKSDNNVIFCFQEMSNKQFDDLEIWFYNKNYKCINYTDKACKACKANNYLNMVRRIQVEELYYLILVLQYFQNV